VKIGLFGGTFNPIHFGHIRLARQLLQIAGLDEVWFMVTPQNPFKVNHELLWDRTRYRMVEMALQRYKHLIASDYEFRLPKPSFTWNTLEALKKDYPDHAFTLLIGGDNWESFPKWYRAADILATHDIVVYPRSGSTIDKKNLPPRVHVVETDLIPISSTLVRQRVAAGKSIRRLVPKAVADYISQEQLYL
jgi:nicotinate-nucleotide adenylyltransferase